MYVYKYRYIHPILPVVVVVFQLCVECVSSLQLFCMYGVQSELCLQPCLGLLQKQIDVVVRPARRYHPGDPRSIPGLKNRWLVIYSSALLRKFLQYCTLLYNYSHTLMGIMHA